ncbi:MAG: succinate dehydrogenase/fumarate reductase iron-sulfur subunit [Caldisphaera sp.]
MALDIEAATKLPPKVITVRVRRYNPETKKIWWQEYKVETHKGMTMLDVLLDIKENTDHTLAVRYSCRMGLCGSCGVNINGTPMLACQTQVSQVTSNARPVVTVEPLPNFPIVKDLMTDFSDFFNKHRSIKPYLIRKDVEEQENPKGHLKMDPEEFIDILQFSNCIFCGLCYSSCPVVAADPEYLGPQALMYTFRFINDVRDEGHKERFAIVDSEHGCHRCHFAATCSAVCPKAVDPAGAIQGLRSKLFKYRLGFYKKKSSQVLSAPPEKGERIPLPPEATTLPGVDLKQFEKEPVIIKLPKE